MILKKSTLSRLKICIFKDRYNWHLPEYRLKSKLFQLLWDQVCLFFSSCLSLMPFQSSFSIHRFNQLLLNFQVNFPYLLNGLSIDSLTFYFPALIIGLAPFRFSMHICDQLRESNISLNTELNIDAIAPLFPSSSHPCPLKLSGAVCTSDTELRTDLTWSHCRHHRVIKLVFFFPSISFASSCQTA